MTGKRYEHPYTKLSGCYSKPLVACNMTFGAKTRRFLMLVDSGSDITVITAPMASALGIDLTTCVGRSLRGVGGDSNVLLGPEIVIQAQGILFRVAPLISRTLATTYGLLGQECFFRAHHVSFERDEERFSIERVQP